MGNSPKDFTFRSNIDSRGVGIFDVDSAKRQRIPPEDGGSLTSTSIFTNDAFWRVSADTKTCGSPL